MGAKQIKDYKNRSNYVYPMDNINPELKKGPDYKLAYVKAMLADYSSNNCQVPFDFGSEYSFEQLRRYAQGREGNSVVKKNYFGEKKKDPKTGLYPTTVNVNWDGTDIMPKFFDVMRSINQKIEYKSTTRAIDGESVQSKKLDREYLKFLIDYRTQETMAMAKYKPSSPVNLEDIGAETEADIDLYLDSGAYSTQREIAASACTQKTNKESDYKVIQDMQFDDMITLGMFAGKNYIDKANNIVKKRYVDPAMSLIPYSKYLDGRNFDKFAEYRPMTIGEGREEFPHIKESQWKIIARDFAYMNPENSVALSNIGVFSNQTSNQYGQDLINGCKFLVLDAQWLSTDTEKRLTNEKKEDEFYKEVPYDYEVTKARKKSGDKVLVKNFIKKYYATWVIGTDILLDHGVCEDLVYYGPDGNKIPKLDYFFSRTGNKSLVERCITHIEDIHLAAVKLRNAIATVPPAPRMVIQQQLMDNVFLNGIRQQPEDLFQKFVEKGILVVNNLDDFNKPIFQNSKAIEFVPTNIMEDITIFRGEIVAGIEAIREVTGLNQAADASTPNPYVGLGKSQMAANAANNALSPTFNAFISFFKRSEDDVVKKWQIIAKRLKGMKLDYAPLGINTMQVLELGPEFTNSDFSVYTEMEFTDDERQTLFAQIIELNKTYVNSQGAAGLNTAEFMHLQEMIMAGNFKFAKYVIARTEKRRELMAIKVKRQSEEMTFKAQRDSLMMNNKFKQEAVTDEERKKLLTVRVSEIEKRITSLYDKLTEVPTDPAATTSSAAILQLIELNQQSISGLIAEDKMADEERMMQNMQGSQQVA